MEKVKMYHKKAYADDISLKEWNASRAKKEESHKQESKAIFKDEPNSPAISSIPSKPVKKSNVDVAIEGIEKTTQAIEKMDHEKFCEQFDENWLKPLKDESGNIKNQNFTKDQTRKVIELMKQDKVLKNLKSERHDLKEKILKLDDVLIYLDENVSKEQLDMMRVQRSIMISYVGALDLRISDLEGKED